MVSSFDEAAVVPEVDATWVPPLSHLLGSDDELLAPNEMDAFLSRLRTTASTAPSLPPPTPTPTATATTTATANLASTPQIQARTAATTIVKTHQDQPRITQVQHEQKQQPQSRPAAATSLGASSRGSVAPRRNKDKIVVPVRDPKNPQVFMDVTIGNQRIGRVIVELFANVVPITAENFRCLCTGEKKTSAVTGRPLHFLGTKFHRVLPGFAIEGGDLLRGNGSSGESIYGETFYDENFILNHDRPGLLSMNNSGRNTNSSLFFIMLDIAPWMDGTHVVFGQIIEGLEVVRRVERTPTNAEDKPKKKVCIADCGEWIAGVTPEYLPVPSTTSQFRRAMMDAGMSERIKLVPQARGGRKKTKREDVIETESTSSRCSAKDDEEIISSGDEDIYNVENEETPWLPPIMSLYDSQQPPLQLNSSQTFADLSRPQQLDSLFFQYHPFPSHRTAEPSPTKQPRLLSYNQFAFMYPPSK